MKKEMFEDWYHSYGRVLTVESCDKDTPEREIRRKAKRIFSSVYNKFSDEMSYKLDLMKDGVYRKLYDISNDFESATNTKKHIERSIIQTTENATKLYNYYFAKKIDKEYFEEMKTFYGETLSELKEHLSEVNLLLHNIKIIKKEVESLLMSE